MVKLNKMKKSNLIKLVAGYETEILNLNEKFDELWTEKEVRVPHYIVLDKDEDDKLVQYLKRRLQCVSGKARFPYQQELDRVMKIKDNLVV